MKIKNFILSMLAITIVVASLIGCPTRTTIPVEDIPDTGGDTPIVVVDISAILGIEAPVMGATPSAEIMNTNQYTGSVAWAPTPTSGLFVASTDYTATITLTAKAGYTLTGVVSDFFTVEDAISVANDADSGVVTAVFPNTGTTVIAPSSTPFVKLGKAGDYAILAESLISTTGTTAITGDLGMSPAATTFVTGFGLVDFTGYATSMPVSLVTGKVYAADMAKPTPANLTTAVSNMITAYNNAAGRATSIDTNNGQDYKNVGAGVLDSSVADMTLSPGVYAWDGTVDIKADLTLSGSSTDVWIFKIAKNLILASDVFITLDGAKAENIFWQVAEITTVGTGAHMEGIVLCKTDIVMQTGSSVNGRLLSQTQVTLDATTVVAP